MNFTSLSSIQIIAIIIFTITYIGIIFTRLPKINIDRPSAAFFGAVAMIFFGVISFDDAIRAIDFNTIALLLGMMIIISTLQLDGFFTLIAFKTISIAKTKFRLLIIIVLVTGVSSAFLVNDAVVLIFTPIIIQICKTSKTNPIPFLLAEIFSSNTGSAMTITGNPQNMLIGISSNINYTQFLLHLFPISIIGLIIIIIFILLFYPKLWSEKIPYFDTSIEYKYNYKSMQFSIPILILVLISFFIGHKINLSIPMIALIGGSLMLILGKIKPSKIIREVDWVLLLFFASLFIVVKAIENIGLMKYFMDNVELTSNFSGISFIHFISLISSQVISNVPFTIVMLPLLKNINDEILWFSIASAATLAGNATIFGAMANLIVIESADEFGIKIKFFQFIKIGLPITIISIIFSILYIFIAMT